MSDALPSLEALASINADGSRKFIHPADTRGRFTTLRALSGWLLIALYTLLPWLPVNGNPAVFLDVARGQYHFFGLTFVSQDVWLAFFVVTGAGFALIVATALWGRIWCGWACPQTVFLEHIYRRIERWLEGDAAARRRLDRAPWTAGKTLRRGLKLALFLAVSFAIAHVFLSYFVSLPGLYRAMGQSPLAHLPMFVFAAALTTALMFNFTWFREQFCIILCPYGRLQSVLIDDDSLVIGYDAGRGEPRGKPRTAGAGDCIDCHRCIQVCPTGIDIRQGLQMECVSCANCIDACDAVMRKLGRAPGLIRYASTNALAGRPSRLLRPRVALYGALGLVGAIVAALAFSGLQSATISALRMTGAPYYVAGGVVRNQYLVRIANKQNRARRFSLEIAGGPASLSHKGIEQPIEIPALEENLEPLVLLMPVAQFQGPFTVELRFRDPDGRFQTIKKVPFLGPDR